MGANWPHLIYNYMNSQLNFDLVKSGCKNTNTFSKRFVVQHHKLIINKHKFEHNGHHSKKKIEDIKTSLYKYIFIM